MVAACTLKQRAALATIAASAALTLGKLVAGLLSGSLALMSEAGHNLADTGMNIAALVGAVFDLTGLELADHGRHVLAGCDDRAGLGRRHQAARTEDLPKPADLAHHVLSRQGHIKVQPAFAA